MNIRTLSLALLTMLPGALVAGPATSHEQPTHKQADVSNSKRSTEMRTLMPYLLLYGATRGPEKTQQLLRTVVLFCPSIIWEMLQKSLQDTVENKALAACTSLVARIAPANNVHDTGSVSTTPTTRQAVYDRLAHVIAPKTMQRCEHTCTAVAKPIVIAALVGMTRELLFPAQGYRAQTTTTRFMQAAHHHVAVYLSFAGLVGISIDVLTSSPSDEHKKHPAANNQRAHHIVLLRLSCLVLTRALLEEGADRGTHALVTSVLRSHTS